MKQLPVTISFEMKDGVLMPKTELNKHLLANYLKNVDEGTIIQVTYEEVASDGTYAQISKLQASTRELSKYLGYTHQEIKDMVKVRAGLYTVDGEIKSFADCSKDELSLAIQVVQDLGEKVDFHLR